MRSDDTKVIWKEAEADRFGVFTDTASYFHAAREAILSARREVILLGWDLHTKAALVRGEDAIEGEPVHVGKVLEHALEQNQDLHIHLLMWDFSMVYALEREWRWFSKTLRDPHPRLHFHMDDQLPAGASHHQKVMVVDGALGFAGGLDLSVWRWDTRERVRNDPRRVDPNGKPYEPYYDVHTVMTGAACDVLRELCVMRWERATGERLESLPEEGDSREPSWPSRTRVEAEKVNLSFARTFAAWKDHVPVREVEAQFLEMIHSAKDYLYFENQYFSSSRIGEALIERIRDPEGPEIVIVLNNDTEGMMEESTMGVMRDYWFARFREADSDGRLGLYFPVVFPDKEESENSEKNFTRVYVHAKVLISDDRVFRIGSANLSNRSMRVDSEFDVIIREGEPSDLVVKIRNELISAHLGVAARRVGEELEEGASLIRAVENLRERRGRTLEPIPARSTKALGEALSRRQILDPDEPIDPSHWIANRIGRDEKRALRRRIYFLIALVAAGMVAALVLKWGWGDVGEPEQIREWMRGVREAPYSLPILVAIFFLAGLVGFSLNALLVGAVFIFGAWPAFLCGYLGGHLSAAVGFRLGRWLGTPVLERFQSESVKKVNRHLEERGILPVAMVRILPVAPFAVVNFVAGSSRLRVGTFHLGTVVGMAPGMLAVTLLAGGVERLIEDPGWPEALQVLLLLLLVGVGLRWIFVGINRAREARAHGQRGGQP